MSIISISVGTIPMISRNAQAVSYASNYLQYCCNEQRSQVYWLENIYSYIVSFILMFPLSVVLPELHSCSRFTSFSSQLKGAIAMSSMLIIIAIIELVVNILAAVVCGKVICCRKRQNPVSQVSSLMLGLIENNNKIHLIWNECSRCWIKWVIWLLASLTLIWVLFTRLCRLLSLRGLECHMVDYVHQHSTHRQVK